MDCALAVRGAIKVKRDIRRINGFMTFDGIRIGGEIMCVNGVR